MTSTRALAAAHYLAGLPAERRTVVKALRSMVKRALPKGYQEGVNYGMLVYEIPLSRYPETYNGQPLAYVAVAAQKNHYAIYLTCAYQDPKQAAWLKKEFTKAGKRMDMGKSCLRFKALSDIPLEAISTVIRSTPPEKFIAQYEASRAR
jgi:hypothetical protein